MIRCLTPYDNEFKIWKNECKALYKKLQKNIGDKNTFEFIINNTYFYLFLDNQKLIGGIYCFINNNKLFLNGFANRYCHIKNLECIKMVTSWFSVPIYAYALNRASALCLLKTGFVRLKDDLFVKKCD